MARRSLVILSLATLLSVSFLVESAARSKESGKEISADDSAVYSAILLYAYRSKVHGVDRSPAPAGRTTVMVQDSTVMLCPSGAPSVPYSQGLAKEDLDDCFTRPKRILSPEVEAELREAIFQGCAQSRFIDVSRIGGAIRLVARKRVRRKPSHDEERSARAPNGTHVSDHSNDWIDTRDYVALSAPGYSKDGHAIVYGEHHCGMLCGSASLFLLERTEKGWKVIRRAMLWIS